MKRRSQTPNKSIQELATGTSYVSNPNASDSTPTNVLGNLRKSNLNLALTVIGGAVLFYWFFLRS